MKHDHSDCGHVEKYHIFAQFIVKYESWAWSDLKKSNVFCLNCHKDPGLGHIWVKNPNFWDFRLRMIIGVGLTIEKESCSDTLSQFLQHIKAIGLKQWTQICPNGLADMFSLNI